MFRFGGLELVPDRKIEVDNCVKFKEVPVKILAGLENIKSKNTFDEVFKKCFPVIDNNSIILYELMSKGNFNINDYLEMVKKRNVPIKEKERVLQVDSQKKKWQNVDNEILLEISEVTSKLKTKTSVENLNVLAQSLKRAKQMSDPVIGPLIGVYLALLMNHNGLIQGYFEKILAYNEMNYYFKDATINASKENFTLILDILKLIHQRVNDRLLVKMFTLKFSKLVPTEFTGEVRRNFDVVLTLDEINLGINSPKYKKYYLFWTEVLQKRGMDLELLKMVKSVVNSDEMIDSFDHLFPLLILHFPTEEKQKTAIANLIKQSGESKDIWKRFIFIYLMDNLNLRSIYGKLHQASIPPSFNLKRNFFLDMLNAGEAKSFPIYQLLLLGDYSPDLFYWFAI